MSVLGGRGAARDDALPLAGCGTSKAVGCIAIGVKRHRAVVCCVGAAFDFWAEWAGGSGGAACEGAYR